MRPARGAGAAHLPGEAPGLPVRARRRAQHRPRRTSRRCRGRGASSTSRTSTSGRSAAAQALADALPRPTRAARRRGRAPVPRPRRARSPARRPASGASAPRASSTRAGGDRVLVCDLENDDGTPIYVHAKVCIVDDVWLDGRLRQPEPPLVDPRLRAVVRGARRHPRRARAARSRRSRRRRPAARARHPARGSGASTSGAPRPTAIDDLLDPEHRASPRSAAPHEALDAWHDGGRVGARPPGHVRIHRPDRVPARHRVVGARGVALPSTTPTAGRDGTGAPTATDRLYHRSQRRPPYRLAA